jgi:hypothetical protein
MQTMELVNVTLGAAQKVLVVVARENERAEARAHAIAGQMDAGLRGPTWTTFARNPTFVEFYTRFMRGELRVKPNILTKGRVKPGEYLYVIDARTKTPDGNVPFYDTIGWYKTGPDGTPRAETFEYNKDHVLVTPSGELSSILLEDAVREAALTV